MNFKEAFSLLNEDKKIRRRAWDPQFHMSLDINREVKVYREECVPFIYDNSICNSMGWVVVGDKDEVQKSFLDIIELLRIGEKIKLIEWPEHCYIELEKNKKDVFMRKICEYNFTPLFECFLENDWEIIE